MNLIIFLVGTAAAYQSQDSFNDWVNSRGYFELRSSYANTEGTSWQTTERARPTVFVTPTDRIKLSITPQLIFTQGRYEVGEFFDVLSGPLEESLPQDMTIDELIENCDWDIEREREIDELNDTLSLERLTLDIYHPRFDLRVGRQALRWGSAQFFNPTDVLSQNLLASPWQERTGVDAARITVPIGTDAQIIGVGTLDDDFNFDQAAIKAGGTIGPVDVYAVGSYSEERWLGGLDIKGDWGIGWWLETAYSDHLKVSLGADYSFSVLDQLVIAAQISHDGSGEEPLFYDWASRQNPDFILSPCPDIGYNPQQSDEVRTTLGRWYGLSTQRLSFLDRWTLSHVFLMNLVDQTGIIFPSVSSTLGSHFQINGGWQYLFGKDGEFQPPDSQLMINGVDISGLTPNWTALAWARFNY